MCPARHTTREAPKAEQARCEARKSSRDEIRKVASLLKNNDCRAAAFTSANARCHERSASVPRYRVGSIGPGTRSSSDNQGRQAVSLARWNISRFIAAIDTGVAPDAFVVPSSARVRRVLSGMVFGRHDRID